MIVRGLDDDRVLDDVLKREDAALNERLLVAGIFVLRRVLRADQLLGVVDALCHFSSASGEEEVQLSLEPIESLLG